MSDDTPTINLLESRTMTVSVQCQLPGDGVDTWKPFPFKATFHVLDEAARDALDDQELSRGDYLREVLAGVDGIPAARDPETGAEVPPKEVAIRNPFTCDALFAEYLVQFLRNSNEVMKRASGVSRKNSRRSRRP